MMYTKPKSHKNFLKSLREMLPKDCKPILVTDAGFRNPWFMLVLSFGWDYMGRIRQNTQCRHVQDKDWTPIKSLYKNKKTKYLEHLIYNPAYAIILISFKEA